MSDINSLIPKDGESINNDELMQAILTTNNTEDFQTLVEIFNMNQHKKKMIRAIKFETLLDQICDEMINRFQACPEAFGNQSLLDYLQTIQKSNQSFSSGEDLLNSMPKINIQNNTQINVGGIDSLNSESRAKIRDLVSNILSGQEKNNNG